MIKKISQLNPFSLALSAKSNFVYGELPNEDKLKTLLEVSYKTNEDDETKTGYYESYQCDLKDLNTFTGVDKMWGLISGLHSGCFIVSNDMWIGTPGNVAIDDEIDEYYPNNNGHLSVFFPSRFDNTAAFHAPVVFHNDTSFARVINGVAYRAQWGDLGEYYKTDAFYEPGTLLQFGGTAEMTIATDIANGVVSTKPGVVLNSSEAESDGYQAVVAVCGKAPVKVVGPVKKFDKIALSEIPGVGMADTEQKTIAIALEDNFQSDVKLVLCSTKLTLD